MYSQWFEPSPIDIAVGGLHLTEFSTRFDYNTADFIAMITDHLDKTDNRGRLASWPVPIDLLFALAAAEYGMAQMSGKSLDINDLGHIMAEIIYEQTGKVLGVNLTVERNHILVLPDYLIY